jgi:hypothetical protein
MRFTGIADPEQINVLSETLTTHCSLRGIVDPQERDAVAQRIMALWTNGVTTLEALLAALASRPEPGAEQSAT